MIDYQRPMRNALTPEQREKLEKMREEFPRRADAVVQYLAGQRDIDFNRSDMIGLGEQKPADTGRTREARARNRRVEEKPVATFLGALAGRP